MITGIDHIEIIVRDLDDYIAFLTTLGFETVRRTEHHGRSVEMKPPGDGQPLFEIHQVSGEEVIGINHIALKIDDAAAAHARGARLLRDARAPAAVAARVPRLLRLLVQHDGPPVRVRRHARAALLLGAAALAAAERDDLQRQLPALHQRAPGALALPARAAWLIVLAAAACHFCVLLRG